MKIFIVVPSISAGIDEQGHPHVTMNFSRAFAEAITSRLFKPYAQPGNFMVSIELLANSDDLEVSAYGVITAPRLLDLPGAMLVQLTSQASQPFEYLVGNEADLGQQIVTSFLAGVRERGYFLLSCGIRTDRPDKTAIVPGWSVKLAVLSDRNTINSRISRAIDD